MIKQEQNILSIINTLYNKRSGYKGVDFIDYGVSRNGLSPLHWILKEDSICKMSQKEMDIIIAATNMSIIDNEEHTIFMDLMQGLNNRKTKLSKKQFNYIVDNSPNLDYFSPTDRWDTLMVAILYGLNVLSSRQLNKIIELTKPETIQEKLNEAPNHFTVYIECVAESHTRNPDVEAFLFKHYNPNIIAGLFAEMHMIEADKLVATTQEIIALHEKELIMSDLKQQAKAPTKKLKM